MTMTPEERAVVQAAATWRASEMAGHGIIAEREALSVLASAVNELFFNCPQCNSGGHTCPGDGEPIGHGDTDCGKHDEAQRAGMQIERESIALEEAFLARAMLEIAAGWSSYIEWLDGSQVKLIRQGGDDAFRVVADAGGGETIGEYVITTSARRLPPIGPEDDGALRAELAADTPGWVPRTWLDVRTGDRVRLNEQTPPAYVQSAMHLHWQTDPRTGTSQYNPPQPLAWSAVRVTLAEKPDTEFDPHILGDFDMDPTKPVDIELSPSEVAAIEAIGWEHRIGLVWQRVWARR